MYPVKERMEGNLSARITQSGRSNIAMARKQNLTGSVSLPPEKIGELDIPVYAARLMLHFCFQCHEKLSCYLFPSYTTTKS